MSDKSAIQWTEATWNPVTGCTKVSPGCAHCYAETLTKRYAGRPGWPETFEPWVPGNDTVRVHPERLAIPLSWRKPRLVFVNSMSDLFHEEVSDEFINQVFAVMALAPQHTFQVLTKRPERMREAASRLDNGWGGPGPIWLSMYDRYALDPDRYRAAMSKLDETDTGTPLPNVWLGVSAENQRWADERIPILLDTPAAVRFVSCEPLLGPLSLQPFLARRCNVCEDPDADRIETIRPALDWVICGGESGPNGRYLVEPNKDAAGFDANQMTGRRLPASWEPTGLGLTWVRSLRDQCVEAGVPFFFKQFGGPRPASGGRLLDGREWNEMPKQYGCTTN